MRLIFITFLICISDVCEALHPELERNESVMNTAIFNVCSSTRIKRKRTSIDLNTIKNSETNDVSF